jgi:hypothetical protein
MAGELRTRRGLKAHSCMYTIKLLKNGEQYALEIAVRE